MTVTARFDRALLARGPRGGGRVLAVYAHATLIAADDGALVTLVPADRPLVPFGVAVDVAALAPRAGQDVVLAAREVTLGGAAVRLAGDGVALEMPAAPAGAAPGLVAAQLAGLALPPRTQALVDGGAADLVAAQAHGALATLVLALAAPAPAAAALARGVAGLCGLGPGATPTGDDLLVGVAAALARLGDPARVAAYAAALRAAPPDATTPVAHAMLHHAAAGAFLEPLRDVAAALGDPGADLAGAAARLAAVGAQSGADLLAGVVAAARALTRA